MTSFQKVIKYAALALALLIVCGIISAIVNIGLGIVHFIDSDSVNANTKSDSYQFTDVSDLNIKVDAGVLDIRTGSGFAVEAKNVPQDFKCEVTDGVLTIRSEFSVHSFFPFWDNKESEIIVYLPKDFVAGTADINLSAGKTLIKGLSCDTLRIETGAGEFTADNITAKDCVYDGGVGNTEMNGVSFAGLDLKAGVGKVSIDGLITGNSRIECGVGELTLNINASADDYTLRLKTGIGKMELNGETVTNNYNTGTGPHLLEINGGIGKAEITFGK